MNDPRPARYFTCAQDWRDWLAQHHESETDIWLGFWKVHTIARPGHARRPCRLPEPPGGQAGIYAYENEARASGGVRRLIAADPEAVAYWESCRPSYRKVVVNWVVSAKRQETRDKRMRELVDDCRAGRPIKSQRYGT